MYYLTLITDKNKIDRYFKYTKCLHERIDDKIPMDFREEIEKIKLNCYFKCGDNELNLYNYAEHLKLCKESNERKKKYEILSKVKK